MNQPGRQPLDGWPFWTSPAHPDGQSIPGCDYTQYTELFPHHCNALLLQGYVKTFQLLFSFYALKKISQVHQVRRNYPSSITFSQLWPNSSQLARLFKVTVALSPDLNTVRWFAKMDLSASVQKQQGRLSASAVKCEFAMPWKWTILAFFTKCV